MGVDAPSGAIRSVDPESFAVFSEPRSARYCLVLSPVGTHDYNFLFKTFHVF
jgi:hypothetical protein